MDELDELGYLMMPQEDFEVSSPIYTRHAPCGMMGVITAEKGSCICRNCEEEQERVLYDSNLTHIRLSLYANEFRNSGEKKLFRNCVLTLWGRIVESADAFPFSLSFSGLSDTTASIAVTQMHINQIGNPVGIDIVFPRKIDKPTFNANLFNVDNASNNNVLDMMKVMRQFKAQPGRGRRPYPEYDDANEKLSKGQIDEKSLFRKLSKELGVDFRAVQEALRRRK